MIRHEAEEQSNRKSLQLIDVPLIANSLEISGDRSTACGGLSRFRTMRWYWFISAVLLLSIVAGWIPGSRRYILRSAGRLLVVQEPSVKSADIIVVAIDADGAEPLEAADLVHCGVSNRVAGFHDPPSSVEREFLSRGLPYEDRAANSTRQRQSL